MFDTMNSIFYKKKEFKYDKKKANAFMLSQWLSHDKYLLNIVNDINLLQKDISDELVYKYYYHKIPKGKRYIKWTKKDKSLKKDEIIKKLASHYNCSVEEMKKSII